MRKRNNPLISKLSPNSEKIFQDFLIGFSSVIRHSQFNPLIYPVQHYEVFVDSREKYFLKKKYQDFQLNRRTVFSTI